MPQLSRAGYRSARSAWRKHGVGRGKSRKTTRRTKTQRRGKRSSGRSKSFKKGAGRLMTKGMQVLPNPAAPGIMSTTKQRGFGPIPPMGRIWASQGQFNQECFCKVTQVFYFTIAGGNVNPVTASLCASDFMSITGSTAYLATCPDFYRAINMWRTITVLGLRMELWTQPVWAGQVTGTLSANPAVGFEGNGRGYSIITRATGAQGISQYSTYTGAVRPTAEYLAGGFQTQEGAEADPTYRMEKFAMGHNTTSYKKAKRFFSRYTPFEYYKTAHEGATNIAWAANVPPVLGSSGIFNQYDMFVQYCDNYNNKMAAANTITCYLRGTLYIRLVGRVNPAVFALAQLPNWLVAATTEPLAPSGSIT
nr:MAG: capsid protein [Cressdnaviricota sp.]